MLFCFWLYDLVQWQNSYLSLQQEFPASWCWSECGPQRPGSRVRHRHRGRRRRARHRSAAPAFRGHDPDSDLRWGAGSLRPYRGPHPIYKINVCIKHHLIHSTSKQQEQIGDIHLLPLHPVGLTGWDGNRTMLAVVFDSCFLSRCDLSILFKAIQLCQGLYVQNGHEDVLVVMGWCVDSLLDLLSDFNLYSDPESHHPHVNVVTSLCCEYQRLLPSAQTPLLWFLFYVGGFDGRSLFWDCWKIVHISILFFLVLFWDHFWITVVRRC